MKLKIDTSYDGWLAIIEALEFTARQQQDPRFFHIAADIQQALGLISTAACSRDEAERMIAEAHETRWAGR